jgi:hypothetical protein
MAAQLQPGAQSGILTQTQPKRRRKGENHMNRRKGQNGAVVIQSGWYRVRWRMDIEGQEERIHMSEKVGPVVIDKDGNSKPASQAVQRLAREIEEVELRLAESAHVGVGFHIPAYIVPNCSKGSVLSDVQV